MTCRWPLFFCSDFLVDLITALLLSDKAISKKQAFPVDLFPI
ncbi:hypothetical protein C7S13_6330 [Burkholderia cepacia]|nr:hypothetical protein [Burkholderia cepacia]